MCVFLSLNQKVAHGGLDYPFFRPRTSKCSFPGTLHGRFFSKMYPNLMVSQIVRVATFVGSFFVCLVVCLFACLDVWYDGN